MRTPKIATRGSQLAQIQTDFVKKALEKEGIESEIVVVKTRGDRDLRPISLIGGDGLFVRETEKLLLTEEADIAVHSAKDLPYRLADGLLIGGVLEEGDPRDCLVIRRQDGGAYGRADIGQNIGKETEEGHSVKTAGTAVAWLRRASAPLIGTGSPRRMAECRRWNPGAQFKSIRGNVGTRLKLLLEGACDAVVLAQAGLDRLSMDNFVI